MSEFLNLGDVPVHVTLTARYCQRLASVLAEEIRERGEQPGDAMLVRMLIRNSEVSMRSHREAGVKPACANVRVLPTGTVVPLRGDGGAA